jgi:DNA-directed RNA polymerase subunit RPC12/RpoP
MSEFKFVCPACGQHIKCESWRRNSMMECPMCFQRVIVPQAPAGDDMELIIKGSKATKRLVTKPATNLGMPPAPRPPAKDSPVAGIAFVILLCAVIAAAFVFGGKIFKSTEGPTSGQTNQTASAPVVTAVLKSPQPTICIKAGPSDPFTDSEGKVWLPDQGFVGGQTANRPDAQIANTKSPAIYRSERYSMTSFSYPVPNGKYTVKLHFAETYERIIGPGQRVFSFNVEGHEFKDFDVWAKAGGALRAYVETVSVEVTNDELDISFTPNVENPLINGIEIIPNWTLNLDKMTIPNLPVVGYIHGKALVPRRMILDLDGLTLCTLDNPPEAGVTIDLRENRIESLFGQSVDIKTNSVNAPQVNLRWKDAQGQAVTQPVSGYALRIEFGKPVGNRLPGKIYLCAPDEMKSYVVGAFNAEIPGLK